MSTTTQKLSCVLAIGVLSGVACAPMSRPGAYSGGDEGAVIEPPLGERAPIPSRRCDAGASSGPSTELPKSEVVCRWVPLEAPCSRCAVLRAAFADCGFRSQNPKPIALGSSTFTSIHHRSEGDYLLAEDGSLTPLPPNLSVVIVDGAPATLSHRLGGEMTLWSRPRGGEQCERVSLPGDFASPFVAPDQSIRGWIGDQPTMRARDGAWSVFAQPEVSTFRAPMPHQWASGLDAQVWTTFEHARFRILARRWGFPPVVITEVELQPVEISSAPPPRGAGPRVPAIVAHRGISLSPDDRESDELRSATFSVELPDRERGFRALPVDLGPQHAGCSKAHAEGERRRPERDVTEINENTKIVRTADDALWLVTRRSYDECTFKLDPPHEPSGVAPPPGMWRPVVSRKRGEIVIYSISEGASPEASEALRVALPEPPASLSKASSDSVMEGGVVGLEVAASGSRLLVMVGGVALWLDMAKVDR